MRITDLVAALGVERLLGVGTVAASLLEDIRSFEVVSLVGPTELDQHEVSAADAVVVVIEADEDLVDLVEPLVGSAKLGALIVLLLTTPAGDLPVDELVQVCGAEGLEVRRVERLDYVTVPTAVVVGRCSQDGLGPLEDDEITVRARLSLQQAVIDALRAPGLRQRPGGVSLEELQAEVRRRGERIEAVTAEMVDLRDRLRAAGSARTKAVAARDKKITALQRRVRMLEHSVSYRLGHALVRIVKTPTLLRKVPGKLVAMLRRRFAR